MAAPDSTQHAAAMKTLLDELIDPGLADEAGRLGADAKDEHCQLELRLRQSDLYNLKQNPQAAADVGWELYELKRLPSHRFDWLFTRLSSAGQPERLIRLSEQRMQAGATLNQEQLDSLAIAYEAMGRRDSAKRARSNASDLKPVPNRNIRGARGGGFMSVPAYIAAEPPAK